MTLALDHTPAATVTPRFARLVRAISARDPPSHERIKWPQPQCRCLRRRGDAEDHLATIG